jgi:membrane protease YdiL (CAAX protease family)
MSFGGQLIGELILTIIVLLWARWSKLDLGLRSPLMSDAWAWTLLFIAWIVLEQVVSWLSPATADGAWFQEQQQLSQGEYILLNVLMGPIAEELLYRGALSRH